MAEARRTLLLLKVLAVQQKGESLEKHPSAVSDGEPVTLIQARVSKADCRQFEDKLLELVTH